MHEQLEGAVGALERVAAVLQLLDPGGDAARQRAVVAEVDAELAGAVEDVGAAGLRADHAARVVAHRRRVDVLVRVGRLAHRVDVLAALVGERRGAHVRRVTGGMEVGDLGDVARHRGEVAQLGVVDDAAGPSSAAARG